MWGETEFEQMVSLFAQYSQVGELQFSLPFWDNCGVWWWPKYVLLLETEKINIQKFTQFFFDTCRRALKTNDTFKRLSKYQILWFTSINYSKLQIYCSISCELQSRSLIILQLQPRNFYDDQFISHLFDAVNAVNQKTFVCQVCLENCRI